MMLDVTADGRLRRAVLFDEHSVDSVVDALRSMTDTCSLDVADRGGLIQLRVANHLGCTRQRVNQIEWVAVDRLKRAIK